MKGRHIFLALVMVLVVGMSSSIDLYEFSLKESTVGTFHNLIDSADNIYLLLLYKGECTNRCKEEFEMMRNHLEEFQEIESSLKLLRVDISGYNDLIKYYDLSEKYGVFINMRQHFFKADQILAENNSTEGTIREIKDILSNKLTEIDSKTQIIEQPKVKRPAKIYFGPKGDNTYKLMEVIVKQLHDPLYYIEKDKVASLFGIKESGFYAYFKEEDKSLKMPGKLTEARIMKFVASTSTDIPQKFNADYIEESFHIDSVPVLIVYAAHSKKRAELEATLNSTKDILRSHFHVYEITDRTDPAQAHYLNHCRRGSNEETIICILRLKKKLFNRYIYEDSHLNSTLFAKFLENYNQNKLISKYKSEDIDVLETGNVFNLNVELFYELMDFSNNNSTQYLVMYYYRDNSPEYESFSEKFQEVADSHKESSLMFGRINLSLNELPQGDNLKTPSIVFTTGFDDPDEIKYDGTFSREDFSDWVKASTEIYNRLEIDRADL